MYCLYVPGECIAFNKLKVDLMINYEQKTISGSTFVDTAKFASGTSFRANVLMCSIQEPVLVLMVPLCIVGVMQTPHSC